MNLENILNNNSINALGVGIAAITLIVSIIIYLLQRQTKQLSYKILSKASLISSKEKIAGAIKIIFQDQEVQNVKLIEVMIENSGNIAISGDDYEKKLTIELGEEAKILSTEIIDKQPENIVLNFQSYEDYIEIEPTLLNQGDRFTVKILVSQISNVIKLNGRIKGVKTINYLNEKRSKLIWMCIAVVCSILGFVILPKPEVKIQWTIERICSMLLILISYLIVIKQTISTMKKEKITFKKIIESFKGNNK